MRLHNASRLAVMVTCGLVAAACGGAASDGTASSGDAQSSSTTVTSSSEPPASSSTSTTAPAAPTTSITASPPKADAPPTPREVTLTIDGPEEIVFDWTSDRCSEDDIPDLPARAFRDADGMVHLISTHFSNRQSIGASLDSVARHCDVILESTRSAEPAEHAGAEWIASVHTDDGQIIHGLVHNEYQGWEHGDCLGLDHFRCWYNTVTSVISTDGGKTFEHTSAPPEHLVAAIPHRYEPESAPVGVFSPSNIVRHPSDGNYYAMVKIGADQSGAQSVCVMRTLDLAEPGGWRFWNGTAFDGEFVDPYLVDPAPAADHECPPLARNEIGAQMIESLTWHAGSEQWVLVGISADSIDGREVWGFYYSFSLDLVNWTPRALLIEVTLPWTAGTPGEQTHLYPSLLDPDSPSLSFETTDDRAYLYFTRFNPSGGHLDRDLVRLPVAFSSSG